MPNWCENKMILKGKTENIVKFMEMIKGDEDPFTFDKIIPSPKKKADCPAKYIIKDAEDARKHALAWDEKNPMRWFNWYSWRYDNWGVKWDCSNVQAPSIEDVKEQKLTHVNIFFSTPWAPAKAIIGKILEMATDYDLYIKFMWYEPGMCFAGEADSDWNEDSFEYREDWDEENDETVINDSRTKEFDAEFYDD